MNLETHNHIEQFIKSNPIASNEMTVYDIQNDTQWTLRAGPKYMLRALDVFLTTEHAIVSHITVDSSASRYVVTIPCAMGAVRAGIYTYNPENDALE